MGLAWEREADRLLDLGLVSPGYDCVIKCSHLFNVLDARGAVSTTERPGYIGRVRRLACACAESYLSSREKAGFPLLRNPSGGDP